MEQNFEHTNLFIKGYFEDYRIYRDHLPRIKSWFPQVPKTNLEDLIIHIRLQNRLVQISHHKNHILFEGYKKGIEKFDFDRVHIVTDAKKWSEHNSERY